MHLQQVPRPDRDILAVICGELFGTENRGFADLAQKSTIEGRCQPSLEDCEPPFEDGQEVRGFLALHDPDLNRRSAEPIIKLDCLQGSGSLLVLRRVRALNEQEAVELRSSETSRDRCNFVPANNR